MNKVDLDAGSSTSVSFLVQPLNTAGYTTKTINGVLTDSSGNPWTAGEDYSTCPEDCPSGGADEYCDGIRDNICDPNCVEFEEYDPDCNLLWKKTYAEMWGTRKAEN